jgi:hypothetical protein
VMSLSQQTSSARKMLQLFVMRHRSIALHCREEKGEVILTDCSMRLLSAYDHTYFLV